LERRSFIRIGLLLGLQAASRPIAGLGEVRRLAEEAGTGEVSDQALELVRGTTVIDMLGLLTLDWQKLYAWQRQPRSFDRSEVARLRASGIRVFHPAVDLADRHPHGAALRCMEAWNRLLAAHPRSLSRIDGSGDLERVRAEDKIGVMLGFQNSNHFRTADDVALFHRLGQRVSQLTYNERNRLGSGCTDPDAGGLSPFGAEIVRAMNRAGMAIDISHCCERTGLDAIALSERPVLISHSNCRALVKHPRCSSDRLIRAMAVTGGVIGITVLPIMLTARRPAGIGDVLDHFDHVAELVGVEHVGLGSDTDLDAIDPRTHAVRAGYRVRGLQHARRVFELAEGLLRRGYGPPEIAGILGGNFQRALGAIWAPAPKA
jgi:membrane dipeptidase